MFNTLTNTRGVIMNIFALRLTLPQLLFCQNECAQLKQ